MVYSSITLSNGVLMPAVGLGTWQSSPGEVKIAVLAALKAGYRLIDTAQVYENEEAIGEAIQEAIATGIVTRDQIFITTKVPPKQPNTIEAALRESLRKLKVEYVDLYLAHVPTATGDNHSPLDVPVESIWEELEHVYNLGLTKSIGVSNWNNDQIARVLKSGKVPVHNFQVELHLYFPQHDHQEFCKSHNIAVTSYGTLGSPGRPSSKKNDEPQHPADLEDPNVAILAKKHNKTPAQILLRYALDRGIAVIPKSVNPIRIEENFKLFDFTLTKDEIDFLESSKINKRLFLFPFMIGHKEDSFASER